MRYMITVVLDMISEKKYCLKFMQQLSIYPIINHDKIMLKCKKLHIPLKIDGYSVEWCGRVGERVFHYWGRAVVIVFP